MKFDLAFGSRHFVWISNNAQRNPARGGNDLFLDYWKRCSISFEIKIVLTFMWMSREFRILIFSGAMNAHCILWVRVPRKKMLEFMPSMLLAKQCWCTYSHFPFIRSQRNAIASSEEWAWNEPNWGGIIMDLMEYNKIGENCTETCAHASYSSTQYVRQMIASCWIETTKHFSGLEPNNQQLNVLPLNWEY